MKNKDYMNDINESLKDCDKAILIYNKNGEISTKVDGIDTEPATRMLRECLIRMDDERIFEEVITRLEEGINW